MKSKQFRVRFAWILLAALILPILAACGGTQAPAGTEGNATSPAPEASAPVASEPASAEPSAAASPAESPATDASPAGSPAGDSEGQYLVYGNSGEPDDLDCMNTTTGTALIVCQQIQDGLVDFEPGTLNLAPALATEWSANEDSTEWTFKLRDGVKFHDGTDFNADAVVFNFQRLADPNFEFGYRAEGKTYSIFPDIFGAYKGEENSLWQDVEKVDDTTVKFTMTQPVPLLPNYLAASYFGIASPEAVQKCKEKYGTPSCGAVGTGAFKFQEWRPAESVTLQRNEDYWGEQAKMAGVVFRIVPDAPQRFTELQAGNLDFTVNLAPDTRETIGTSGNLEEVQLEPFNIAYLSLDMSVKPLDDVRVRQAIAHAIDKQAILDAFYGGVGTVATDFLPEGLAEFRPTTVQEYEFDPEKAKQLLAEAGYADGFDTMTLTDGTELALELWYMPVSRPYYPTAKAVAEAYQTYLSDVGINVELKTEDWGVYLDNWDAGNKHGLVMLGWTGDYADPANFLFTHFGPGNQAEAGYVKPELWQLMSQATAASSEEESIKLWQQAGDIINQDLPRIPIVHAPPVYAQKTELSGWTPNPTGGESYAPIEIGR